MKLSCFCACLMQPHEAFAKTQPKEKTSKQMWQEPWKWMIRVTPVLQLALIACSVARAQDVRTNYLPGTDFSKYRTYSWVSIPSGGRPDQIVDTEIKQSIDSQLVAKGFTKVDSGTSESPHAADFPGPRGLPPAPNFPPPPNFPQATDLPQMADSTQTAGSAKKADLLIGYQVGIDQERQWTAYGMGDGFPWAGMRTGTATATSSTIEVGTLVLDIYDPATKQLVWSGTAKKTINLSKDQQKNQRNLDKAMQKLLKDFPPRAR